MHYLTIDQLAAEFGITPRTVRYYRQLGALPPPSPARGRHARYSDEHVRRIRRLRQAVHDERTTILGFLDCLDPDPDA